MDGVFAQDLEKSFGIVRALGPVSFHIPPGTQLALLGESGSGKSTLLNLIGCMEPPTRGRLEVAGRSTLSLGDRDLAEMRLRNIGYVHQFFDLVSDLSALENVELPLWMAGVQESRARAESLLKELGLGHRLDHSPGTLSGGEQQRVAIARALALEPKLVLADEPSGSLDSKTGMQVIELLQEYSARHSAILVVATHSDRAAEKFKSRIRLRDGKISELELPVE